MNKFFSSIILCLIILFTGCASQSVKMGNLPNENKDSAVMVLPRASKELAGESLWIIKGGLKGEAGLYAEAEALPVKSLDMDVNIIEFLASVDIAISYSRVISGKELSFKYPTFLGTLVRDFQAKIGDRKFRAVISEKESAEEIYKLAKNRGFNAVIVSQKAFGEMIVNASLKEESNIEILFSYTQLSSVLGQHRALAFPEFKGLENAEFNLDVTGRFLSPLISLTGLNKKIKGNKFFENIKDKGVFRGGLLIKYELDKIYGLSSDKKTMIMWNAKTKNYSSLSLAGIPKYSLCDEEIIKPVSAYLKLQEMIKNDKPFKDIQGHAVQSKLLTPITRLLLIDTSR